MENSVFKSVISGRFYPSEKTEVLRVFQSFEKNILEFSSDFWKKSVIKGAIVPHAGYEYSGQVAYNAYYGIHQNFEYQGISNPDIYIFAPSHHEYFRGVAALKEKEYETPLGNIPIRFQDGLIQEELVHFYRPAFDREHSMEVHLPFIRYFFPDSVVHPMVIGAASFSDIHKIIRYLENDVSSTKKEKVYIISSDMSHFLSYSESVKKDRRTIQLILDGKEEELDGSNACGYIGIGGIILASKTHGWKAKNWQQINSGDITKDYKRVVGYATIFFYKEQ